MPDRPGPGVPRAPRAVRPGQRGGEREMEAQDELASRLSVLQDEALDAIDDEYSQPLVRLVDAILADAVKREASDIHFEPEESFLRIRYRIDGVLRQIRSLHKTYWSAIAVRLKVMAGSVAITNGRT